MTVGALLVGIGAVALLATLDVEIPVRVIGPILLIVLGVGVTVSAIRGERHGALVGFAVLLGVVLAAASVFAALVDVPVRGSVGDREYRPTSVAELEDEYHLLMGSLTVDLTGIEFPEGTTAIEVSTVFGEVRVRLPADVAVDVDAGVAAGTADVLGSSQDGLNVDNDRTSDGYDTATRRIELHARAGFGDVRVTR